MARRPEEWARIEPGPDTTLLMGWRPSRDRLAAEQVELSGDVAAEMRAAALATASRLASMRSRPREGDPAIEEGEEYLAIDSSALGLDDSPEEASRDSLDDPSNDAEAESALQRLIVAAFEQPFMNADELREGSFLFYAVVLKDASGSPVGFVKMWNPHRGAKAGRIWTVFSQTLEKLERPVFVFEPDFDLIVTASELAVLRQLAFDRLFADMDLLRASVPINVAGLTAQLPFSDGGARALEEACLRSRSLARRLQRLSRAPYLADINMAKLRKAMVKHGIEPRTFIRRNQLDPDDEGTPTLLDLLEQLYFETDFTNEHRRADRYSPLASGGPPDHGGDAALSPASKKAQQP